MKLERKLKQLSDPKLVGTNDLPQQVVPYLTHKIIIESYNHLVWKRPLRSSSPSTNLTLQSIYAKIFKTRISVLFCISSE